MIYQAQVALAMWLWIAGVSQTTEYCPPCPAEPPCACDISAGEQFLSCPQTEFPKLADGIAANKTPNQYCHLRIAHSNFVEIPANALASLNRWRITFELNPQLSVIKAFAFNGTTLTDLVLWLGPTITVIEPFAFSGGDTLRSLTINGRSMPRGVNGTALPDDIFAGLKGLRSVYLDGLNLTTIPRSLLKLRNIERLSLKGNQLTAEDLDHQMPAWNRLEFIDLSGNNLENIPTFFQKLKRIKSVWIASYFDEKQERLVCGSQLCWLSGWDALYQKPDNGSAAVDLHANCRPKECIDQPFTSFILSDVRDFVIRSGICNVSVAINDSFRQNIHVAMSRKLESLADGVKRHCSAKRSASLEQFLAVSCSAALLLVTLYS